MLRSMQLADALHKKRSRRSYGGTPAGFAERYVRNIGLGAPGSFALEVRGLDKGPPLFDLGLLKRTKRLRGLLVARRDFLA